MKNLTVWAGYPGPVPETAPRAEAAVAGTISIQCALTDTNRSPSELPPFVNGTFDAWIFDVNSNGYGQGAIELVGSDALVSAQWALVTPNAYVFMLALPGFVQVAHKSLMTGTPPEKGQASHNGNLCH